MVKEVPSWQAEDGTLFLDERKALEHDAVEGLKATGLFNHPTALGVVTNIDEVRKVLKPLIAYVDSLPRPSGELPCLA
jgi:hypothetical protein